MNTDDKYLVIVIGISAGGLTALSFLLEILPADFRIPIVIVQHRTKDQRDLLEDVLQHKCRIRIKQADEKEPILSGNVYFAPPDYHLLIENDFSFSLSTEAKVHFSRPSIDVLFESACHVYGNKLVGIILTGANNDGANGIAMIKKKGGLTIAQNPSQAEFPIMPQAAIHTGCITHIWLLEEIRNFLLRINQQEIN